jgi:hypothetical protein
MKVEDLLTEKMLAEQVTEATGEKITPRTIAEWRRLQLIPDFEITGKGLGKRKGKANSGWSNGKAIVEQTSCIIRLRKLYPTLADLYLPLWSMGYSIPNQIVYDELRAPIDWLIEDLDEMAGNLVPFVGDERSDELISDVLSDSVFNLTPLFDVMNLMGSSDRTDRLCGGRNESLYEP